MFERTGRPISTWLTVGVGAALTASFATSLYAGLGDNGSPLRWTPTPELVLVMGVGLICSATLWQPGRPLVESTANTLFGAVYIGWLLGYAVWLQGRAAGPQLVLFLVGVTWAGESAAYLVGSSVGRHPLAPILSPRKTVEGAIAQIVVSLAAAPPRSRQRPRATAGRGAVRRRAPSVSPGPTGSWRWPATSRRTSRSRRSSAAPVCSRPWTRSGPGAPWRSPTRKPW